MRPTVWQHGVSRAESVPTTLTRPRGMGIVLGASHLHAVSRHPGLSGKRAAGAKFPRTHMRTVE